MVHRKKPKRFSVSLTPEDHAALEKIARKHKPPLSLQYVVNWAVQALLERAEDPQLYLDLANPLENKKP
jgi:hypothetical protein